MTKLCRGTMTDQCIQAKNKSATTSATDCWSSTASQSLHIQLMRFTEWYHGILFPIFL